MANVWAYEAAHKKRQTILNRLETIAQRLQAGEDPAQDEEPKEEPHGDEGDGGETSEASDDAPVEEPAAEQQTEPEPEAESAPDAPEEPEAEVEAPKEEEKPKRRGRQKKQDDESGDPDYEQIVKKVEEDLARERVHKPKAPEEDIPDLPWDWTRMTDKELQKFHGIYSSVAYYKGYQLAREERMALHCKAAADELHNALLVALDKYDDHGKEKKVALIEAEVESDENIKMWRRRQRKHEQFAASHRNERDSVGKLVDALSRTESMRHQEWERSVKLGRQK